MRQLPVPCQQARAHPLRLPRVRNLHRKYTSPNVAGRINFAFEFCQNTWRIVYEQDSRILIYPTLYLKLTDHRRHTYLISLLSDLPVLLRRLHGQELPANERLVGRVQDFVVG